MLGEWSPGRHRSIRDPPDRTWGARTPSRALHGRDARARFDSLCKRADAGELVLPGDPPQTVTAQDLQTLALAYTYDPASWFEFAWTLTEVDAAVPGAARALRKHGERTAFPFYPVMCQEYDFAVPSYAPSPPSPLQHPRPDGPDRLPGLADEKVTNPQRRLSIDAARQIGREAVFLTYDGVGYGDCWLSPCARGRYGRPGPRPTAVPDRRPHQPLPELLGTGTYR
ncbi:hypothetical protein [Streptomyces sp. NL15-2K]|uniref:hypothetical protein n=1 Tax=Streptomyces sp. NL15-2K TaxID=376149 RepID=UPI000F581670|nr:MULTISPECIES: hypothetical protein [Actinomycetes]WKX13924.1 hypothetical protein Q4V64_42930 [Kutzneria buriramensis]GCB50889.1 hypothetical protein SNL152K_8236 [Streptomyces sp. NL15-2K]